MTNESATGAALWDGPERGETVIVPPMAETEECVVAACPTDPADVAWLTVTIEGSVDSVLDRWRHGVGAVPGALSVVSVNESTRSAAATPGVHDVVDLGEGVTTTVVRDPTDLTQLGFRTSRCLGAIEDGEHDELVVCVDSLTALLRFCEVKPAFRFLHVLTSRLQAAGARSHVHYDPAAHDDRTAAILTGVVDEVREFDTGPGPAEDSWPGDWTSAAAEPSTGAPPEPE